MSHPNNPVRSTPLNSDVILQYVTVVLDLTLESEYTCRFTVYPKPRSPNFVLVVCLQSAVMLAFHDADTDTDTDTDSPNTATILRPTHAISSRGLACVGRKIAAVFGESVSVSASWNASFNPCVQDSSGRMADQPPIMAGSRRSRMLPHSNPACLFVACGLAALMLFCIIELTISETVAPNKLLLVLVDGFRWDYFDRFSDAELPGFSKLRRNGVAAESLVPVFPSLSFVNYYSIMTGKARIPRHRHPDTDIFADFLARIVVRMSACRLSFSLP